MGNRPEKYKKQSRSRIAKMNVNKRLNRLILDINKTKRNIGLDIIEFLTSLEERNAIKKFACSIKHKSAQWNAIRRKYISASLVNKICRYKKDPSCIAKKLNRFVTDRFISRGEMMEQKVNDVLIKNGYHIKHQNEIWVHKNIKWLICSIDRIIVEKEDSIKAAVEIKSFTSQTRFDSVIKLTTKGPTINTNSNEYAQVQMIAEIINVPSVLLIVEFKFVIKRDMDFLWHRFEKLKKFYLTIYIPFLHYETNASRRTKELKNNKYFGNIIYGKLLKLLEKRDD